MMKHVMTSGLLLICSLIKAQIAIVNVNVIPLTVENLVLEHQTVLVSDGVIENIGNVSSVVIPDNYTQVDGRDKFMIPGMMDAHAHLPITQGIDIDMDDYLWLQLANGVTSLRCGRYEVGALGLRDSLIKADAVIPRLFLSSPMVSVSGPELSFDYTNATSLIPSFKEAGYDHLKYLSGLNPYTHKSITSICENNEFPVFGHLPGYVGLDYALQSGQKGIEHFQSYVDLDSIALQNNIKETTIRGVLNCPTIFWYHANTPFIALEGLMSIDGLEYIKPSLINKWKENHKKYTKDGMKSINDEKRVKVLKEFVNSEALMLISHGDGDFCVPGFGMLEEMKIFKHVGYSNYKVLEAACKNGAIFYKQTDDWGSLEEGKRADMILLEGNPLEKLNELRNIEGIVVKGKWIDKKSLSDKLKQIENKVKKLSN